MRIVVQRVASCRVVVDNREVASIGRGLLALVGAERGDGKDQADWVARKLAGLRVFEDGEGRMNLSVTDVGGEIMVVSQFTLLGDCRKGRRPSFVAAARPEEAEPLVAHVVDVLEGEGVSVQTGVFGANMRVELVNDGPVTLVIER